jgi:peptidoglycan pentaglycine glycine transferase (the first glycine)
MIIEKIEDKNKWNKFILEQEQSEFLHSFDWGEFQENTGKEVIRLRILDEEKILGQIQGIVVKLAPGFKYLNVSRYDFDINKYKKEIFEYLKKQGFVFIRLESAKEKFEISDVQVEKVNNRQPVDTLILDLKKSEEELMSEMHSKTRYNIRLAGRKNVIIKKEKDVDVFWKLNQETTGRDKFKSHDRNYYKKMLDSEIVYQMTAYLDDEPIASNIFVGFGDVFTYLHGTSSNKNRNVMAPYLLQWQGIEEAKKLGYKYYDFWGISPFIKNKTTPETCFNNFCWQADHKWTGITRFKTGFGGERKNYPEAVEVILNKSKYKFYNLIKKIF